MRNLSNHVGVVKLYECCETRDYVYILMEAAKRGCVPACVVGRDQRSWLMGEACRLGSTMPCAGVRVPCPSRPTHPALRFHCCCSSLLDYVRERKKLPEEEATTILQQLLHSLQFCHRKDVSCAGRGAYNVSRRLRRCMCRPFTKRLLTSGDI